MKSSTRKHPSLVYFYKLLYPQTEPSAYQLALLKGTFPEESVPVKSLLSSDYRAPYLLVGGRQPGKRVGYENVVKYLTVQFWKYFDTPRELTTTFAVSPDAPYKHHRIPIVTLDIHTHTMAIRNEY